MKLLLKITCETAVTPSSGESWGGVIDTDVAYDECGIPFIPARRLKGILREAALDVAKAVRLSKSKIMNCTEDDWKKLFGEEGKESTCSLSIDNAYILHYEPIFKDLTTVKVKAPGLAATEQVLSLFTGTRAQTAVANPYYHSTQSEGIALEHSLRFQRVLNRGLIFESKLVVNDDKYVSLLAMAAQASRHLGLNRNRGLGHIKMELLDEDNLQNQFEEWISKTDFVKERQDG